MSDKKIEISALTGEILGNGLSLCAQTLAEILAELRQGDISFAAMRRLENAIEFVGGVGGDFSKHAKKVQRELSSQ